jgi:glycosyltransferase involved in cell wall biosynthesis
MAISAFMVVRDVASQGYPFIEAIASAIPICDEFLVSDGYSTDGTWEALQILGTIYPGKIQLFRDRWRGSTRHGGIIATMTNVLKRRCRFEYCLNLQANEIVHEAAAAQIRDLPMLYPDADLFRLPFLTLLGTSVTWLVDFRRRLFRNLPYVVSKADGFDCGYEPRRMWNQPRKLFRYLLHRTGERLVYLDRPFYRYRAVFPEQYLRKLEQHALLYQHDYQRELAFARRVWAITDVINQTPDDFWNAMREFFDNATWRDCAPGEQPRDVPRRMIRFPIDPPHITSRLAGRWRYDVEASLAALRLAPA